MSDNGNRPVAGTQEASRSLPEQGNEASPAPVRLRRTAGRKYDEMVVERHGQETMHETQARIAADVALSNSSTVARFASFEGPLDVTMLAEVVSATAAKASEGDLAEAKAILMTQAMACTTFCITPR